LLAVITELLTYGKYYNPAGTAVWLSKGKADYLTAQGETWTLRERITSYIKLNSIDPTLIVTGIDKVRGILTPIVFTMCNVIEGRYDYDVPNFEQVGHVFCSKC